MKLSVMIKLLYICIGTLVASYCALLIFVFLFSDKLIFPCPKSSYVAIKNLQYIQLPNAKKIATLFLENKSSDICVIYSHGNGEDLGKILPVLEQYQKRGVNIFAYDYCGYGLSDANPTESDLPVYADCVYNHVVNKLKFAPEKIVFIGYSLGSVPTSYLAKTHPEAKCAVIVGGVANGIKTILPFDPIPWSVLKNVDNVAQIKIPTLFFHGTKDKVVHIRNLYENLNAIKAPYRFVKYHGFGHRGFPDTPEYWSEVFNFINAKKYEKCSVIDVR